MAAFSLSIGITFPILISLTQLLGVEAGVLQRRTDGHQYLEPAKGWQDLKYPDDAGTNLKYYPEPKGGWENVKYPSTMSKQQHGPQRYDMIDGWTHFGCWSAESSRALTTAATSRVEGGSDNMTVAGCIAACSTGHYPLVGVQDGGRCYCSTYVPVTMKEAAIGECNQPCNGNKNEYCGAEKRLNLYYPSDQEPPLRPEPKSSGPSKRQDLPGENPVTTAAIPDSTATVQANTGPREDQFSYATGPAAGSYEFLIGGPVIPLLTQPARNGKIMFLEKWGTGPDNSTGAYEFDPSQTDNFEAAFRTLNPVTDIFCAAGVTLPDRAGRQINIGGWDNQALFGLRLYTPDGAPGVPGTNNWEENLDEVALLAGRWYPSAMNMANGSVLVVGGEDGPNGPPQPNLEIVPSPNGELVFAEWLQRTDPYNLYPFLFVLPSGGIFIAYHNEARILDPDTLGTQKVLSNMPADVPEGGRTYPFEGTGMALPMYAPYEDPMEIIVCGGSSPGGEALNDCVSMTPDAEDAEWIIEKMPSKRVLSCMAPLPDGSLMIMNGAQQGIGGFDLADNPNLNAVHYDPSKPRNRRMTVMANTTIARLYHSEATLMDDGRILVSGSDPQDPDYPQEYRYEVFIPPHLMGDPNRPAMAMENLDWGYGDEVTFGITPSGAGAPAEDYRVSLIAAISSTHGASMGHRTLFPATTCTADTCTVRSPPGPNIAPPGWYQVFLLDGDNVPSMAAWVRIGGDPAGFGNWPDNADFTRPGMGAVEALF